MRHHNLKTALRGTPSHRRAMMSNMLTGLLEHGRIKTTEKRAKLLRSIAEKMVTRATALGDILLKDQTKLNSDDKALMIHTVRMIRRRLNNRQAISRLFDDIAPRYLGRPGGYTRMYKLGYRKGDNAPMAILEFIEADMPEREGVTPPPTNEGEKAKKGRLGWLNRSQRGAAEKKSKAAEQVAK